MSKLFIEYLKMKKEDNNKIYLFKNGIFYIALEEDAKKLSQIFKFKISNLNQHIIKCGFPLSRLSYYSNLMKLQNLNFEIVNLISKENYEHKLINSILNLDLTNITFREAFDFLAKIQNNYKDIYK